MQNTDLIIVSIIMGIGFCMPLSIYRYAMDALFTRCPRQPKNQLVILGLIV
jgi:hypothetical protein